MSIQIINNQKACAAFVQAQRNFEAALKTSTNPHFKSKYSDLSAVIEAVISALNNAGLGLIQMPTPTTGGVSVETVFVHESGERLSGGTIFLPATKQDAQGYGSALTYARRYGLMSACGIAPEDDDGNAAVKAKEEELYRKEKDRLTNLNLSLKNVQNSSTIEELKLNAGKAKLLVKPNHELDELLVIFNEMKEKIEKE